MCNRVPTIVMLLALLEVARGQAGPRVPRSVVFSSLNLKHLVIWEPALVAPRGLDANQAPLYSVQVLGDGWEVWRDAAGCVSTPRTECDVTELLADPDLTYRARVSRDPSPATPQPGEAPPPAASGPQWAYSGEFMPSQHTVLGAPSLTAQGGNGSVQLLLTEPLTPLRDSSGELIPLSGATPDLIYLLMYWKDGSQAQQALTIWGGQRTVHVEGLEAGTTYCMYAEAWEDAWYRRGTAGDVICATTLSEREEGSEEVTTARPASTGSPRVHTECGGERLDARGDGGMGWVYGLVAGAALLGFGAGLSLSLCLVKWVRRPNSVHPFSPGPSVLPTSPSQLMGPERII